MLNFAVLFSLSLMSNAPFADSIRLSYTLRVDPGDSSGFSVELRIHNAPQPLRLAAAAHPEYDDKYWRHIRDLRATDTNGNALAVISEDSVVWQVSKPGTDVIVRYRLELPREPTPRAAWRPFLSATGGLVGGPHAFLYPIGAERAAATVKLELPARWRVATGLPGGSVPATYIATDLHALMEAPMLVGQFSEWTFRVKGIAHRIAYWRLPEGAAFDTTAFVNGIEKLARQSIELFGGAPYRNYTFLFQDNAWGGLEHPNSVTLGANSADLARNANAHLPETAHEFFHTWNLMHIKPVEYRGLDYRTQPPVTSLWFSEGLTIFYADLLLRRAGLPAEDSTRIAHLESLIERYLYSPGNARFSAEQVSRVAYNAPESALGDYTASSHLQGEVIGALLDLTVRAATDGARSMDDVMRLMNTRAPRGFTGGDVQRAVEEVCKCSVSEIFDRHVRSGNAIDFNRHLAKLGLRATTSWKPALRNDGQPEPDLRMWGWQEPGEDGVRLRVTDAASVWGRAGLHTDDRVISINGTAVKTWPELRTVLRNFKIGDAATFVVDRTAGRFETRVVGTGHLRPVVKIEALPGATGRQRRLLAQWAQGR